MSEESKNAAAAKGLRLLSQLFVLSDFQRDWGAKVVNYHVEADLADSYREALEYAADKLDPPHA